MTQNLGARASLLLCGVGFLVSVMVLQTTIWPRWGPTVAVLAGLLPLVVFGWLIRWLSRDAVSEAKPEAQSRRGPIFKLAIAIPWLLMMLSWFPMAEIETAALSQPHRPSGQFTQPINVKGVVRYVTPKQASIDQICRWTFFGGWVVLFSGIPLERWWAKRRGSG
jgi:hypothetical protein